MDKHFRNIIFSVITKYLEKNRFWKPQINCRTYSQKQPPRVVLQKAIKNFTLQILFLINVQANRFVTQRFWQRHFHVNFANFSRAVFLWSFLLFLLVVSCGCFFWAFGCFFWAFGCFFSFFLLSFWLFLLVVSFGCFFWLLLLVVSFGYFFWLFLLVISFGCFLWTFGYFYTFFSNTLLDVCFCFSDQGFLKKELINKTIYGMYFAENQNPFHFIVLSDYIQFHNQCSWNLFLTTIKGTLMQIWKSANTFVFRWK